jgi:hypothetical protein
MLADVGLVQTRTLKTFRAWGRAFEDGDVDVASPSVSGVGMSSSP